MSEMSVAQVTPIRLLGRGGSATVHEALVGGRSVALKRPRSDVLLTRPEARTLFEREYHTLAQLAHPNIVEVYGYAIDAEGPYYTMELLADGDLSELLPMDYRRACAVLRDVAAALAMVHARRLVHRDVTLHNVRLTEGGRAKLMDFGALTPIGIPRQTIGTPAFMAPEAVYRQALDQRTDLYALGALGYRLLSGRDAYPARRIDQLRDTWRSRPRALRERAPEIPEQLEELIRQLLSLNPDGRPRSAAEVIVRLSAIARLDSLDEQEIARAYLATPALVGRDAELSLLRRQILQSARARGSCVLVEGPAGVGRSRLLDACITDGQLMGARVLRARAQPSAAQCFELVASLGRQLLEADADGLPLSPRVRALLEAAPGAKAPLPSEEDGLLQQELVAWLLQSATKPLLFVIDDLHLSDVDSAAVLVRVAEAAGSYPIALICSALSGAAGPVAPALRLLRERAVLVELRSLDEQNASALVRSLFGEVENVQLAARRIYDVAAGNPRASVDLAEWLVEGGHVIHEGGRWLMPDTLAALPLPARVEDALRQRLAQLGVHAVALATAIASARDIELRVDDYTALIEQPEALAQAALAELLKAQVLSVSGDGHTLSQEAFRPLLIARADRATLERVHRGIARVCFARDESAWGIYHLFRGDAREEALELLLAELARGASPARVLSSLEERVSFLRAALEFAESRGRPARDLFALKLEIVRRAEVKMSLARAEIAELSQLFRTLTGYDVFQRLPADMPATARIAAALAEAARRHAETPREAQIMGPKQALPSLMEFVSACLPAAAANSELALIEQVPSLAPFTPLSEGVRLLARYVEAVKATISGHADVASATFIAILAQLEGEAGRKLGATGERMRRHALVAVGMLNAGLSRSVALDYADQLHALSIDTKDAYAKSTSLRVRHQYHLRRGNFRQAQHWQHEVELDKLTDRSAVFHPAGIFALSWIHATLGNIAGMRDCLTQMREYGSTSDGLRTWECFVAAEYDRLRGAREQALPQYLSILEGAAGRHMAWLYAAHGVLLCLGELGRLDDGKALGDELLRRADAAALSAARGLILRPLSLIEARLGNFLAAERYLSENIAQCRETGMGGINLGIAYEFRARVAVWAQDREAFQRFTELCAEQYHAGGGSPDLDARLDALVDEARRAGVIEASWRSPQLGPMTLTNAQVELRDRLADCADSESRCAQALHALVQMTKSAGGYLCRCEGDQLVLLAHDQPEGLSPAIRSEVEEYLRNVRKLSHGSERPQTASDVTGCEADATASLTATKSQRWEQEICAGLVPLLLSRGPDASPLGVALFKRGSMRSRAAEPDLLDVVVDALIAGGELRASERRHSDPPLPPEQVAAS